MWTSWSPFGGGWSGGAQIWRNEIQADRWTAGRNAAPSVLRRYRLATYCPLRHVVSGVCGALRMTRCFQVSRAGGHVRAKQAEPRTADAKSKFDEDEEQGNVQRVHTVTRTISRKRGCEVAARGRRGAQTINRKTGGGCPGGCLGGCPGGCPGVVQPQLPPPPRLPRRPPTDVPPPLRAADVSTTVAANLAWRAVCLLDRAGTNSDTAVPMITTLGRMRAVSCRR